MTRKIDFEKEWKRTLKKAQRGTAEILESMKKDATERCDKALAETREAITRTEEMLAKAKESFESETKTAAETVDDYVTKAERIQGDLDLAMIEMSAKVMDRSFEGAEAAISKARKALDKAEELVDKAKKQADLDSKDEDD